MKTVVMLFGWNYFSEYYCKQVANLLKNDFEVTITENQDPKYLDKFDIVWSFFPQFPKNFSHPEKVIKTFWEAHELGWDLGKVNVACSLKTFKKFIENCPEARYASLGVNTDHFFPQPFPEGKIKIGWCGQADSGRKRFKELENLVSKIEEVEFNPNIVLNHYNGIFRGKYDKVYEMNDYYRDIHIYACSSAGEGFGLPLLEASACGRPVVTFDVGIARELKDDGAGIILVDTFEEMENELRKLSKDRKLIEELGKKSSKAAKDYWHWARFSKQWLSIFKSI